MIRACYHCQMSLIFSTNSYTTQQFNAHWLEFFPCWSIPYGISEGWSIMLLYNFTEEVLIINPKHWLIPKILSVDMSNTWFSQPLQGGEAYLYMNVSLALRDITFIMTGGIQSGIQSGEGITKFRYGVSQKQRYQIYQSCQGHSWLLLKQK